MRHVHHDHLHHNESSLLNSIHHRIKYYSLSIPILSQQHPSPGVYFLSEGVWGFSLSSFWVCPLLRFDLRA